MKFLLLLLPNLYDIFTLLMIGYAFFLDHNSELQIPFVTACLLIYATTRIGIFAGKIVNLMAGKSNAEQQNLEEPEDVVVKKMVLGIIPQCIFIIICQVIFALCFLQNPAAAKYVNPDKLNQGTAQQLPELKFDQNASQSAEEQVKDQQTNNLDEGEDEEEIETPINDKKPAAAPAKAGNKVKRTTVPAKKSKADIKQQTAAQNNVYYEIPDNTLRSAGISPAERRITYSQKNNSTIENSSIKTTNNSGNWSFSSANSTVSRVAQNTVNKEPAKQKTPTSGMQPKRYPGDDNPLNTNWGYYKHTEKPVSQTQTQSSSQQQRPLNIPANTLRSIGY